MTDAPNLKPVTNPSEASRLIDMAGDAVRGEARAARMLPCPFCGGIAEIERSYHEGPYPLCGDCGAATMWQPTDAEAIAAWNTRATPKTASIDALREALKPFADAAEDLDDAHRENGEIWEAPAAMSITAGDLRRARAALRLHNEGDGR